MNNLDAHYVTMDLDNIFVDSTCAFARVPEICVHQGVQLN